jgi:threonylcarbamoyladenosine tRNA methylthiotransferase MtaB
VKSIAVLTLGCKLNQYESMGIREALESKGYQLIDPELGADLYIVNTCTVTGKTDRRSRNLVRRVLSWNPDASIVVTGCSVQRSPEEFAALPNVKLVAGNQEKNSLASLIEQALGSISSMKRVQSMDSAKFENLSISQFGKYTRAFLKIQEGCNRHCSYCIIPAVRGTNRSQSPFEAIAEARKIAESGFREIVLTGIDLGSYGLDLSPPCDLLDLLKGLASIDAIRRIRLSSIEPTPLLARLVQYFADECKICRHLHIPLQSGCDEILARMNRNYLTAEYRAIIETIKAFDHDFCLGADVITAFPGETESQFKDTYDFISELDLDYLHVFTFSPREGTPAAEYPNRVHPDDAKKRCHMLRALSREKASRFRRSLIGKQFDTIVLGSIDAATSLPVGLTGNYVKVLLNGAAPPPGSIFPAEITDFHDGEVFGRIIDS